MDIIKAPFSPDQIQELWKYQTGEKVYGSLPFVYPGHPFTCINRADGRHRPIGPHLGLLIPRRGGWMCPFCDYRQTWAHRFMAESTEGRVIVDIPEKIKNLISEIMCCDSSIVTPTVNLVDELGADSLDVVEIGIACEAEFGIQITDADYKLIDQSPTARTFSDLVEEKLKEEKLKAAG